MERRVKGSVRASALVVVAVVAVVAVEAVDGRRVLGRPTPPGCGPPPGGSEGARSIVRSVSRPFFGLFFASLDASWKIVFGAEHERLFGCCLARSAGQVPTRRLDGTRQVFVDDGAGGASTEQGSEEVTHRSTTSNSQGGTRQSLRERRR
ncbi:hypothetical protein BDY21DRAFT_351015 [Lineolata rhizophorae]|uniref:Uncharacterized protein n=1 Tax=Lineolata rhizophorae TaxID=578093 RepID=A0A6A6NU11_9PEZI|nr:hypothetical protein BDY21DRAFT_351015 [Lineolata rhizophorae]